MNKGKFYCSRLNIMNTYRALKTGRHGYCYDEVEVYSGVKIIKAEITQRKQNLLH